MYSLLMMTALASGAETPSFGWRTYGCGGCTGTTVSSCNGCYSSCSGCAGYYTSCSGCTGYYSSCTGCSGVLFPRIRSLFAWSSCVGCNGSSCSGYTYTSCGGCSGYYPSSCYGCGGCHSSVYGVSYGSCFGSNGISNCYGFGSYNHTIVSPEVVPGQMVGLGETGNVIIDNRVTGGSTYANAPRYDGVGYHGAAYSGTNYAAFPGGLGVRTFAPGYSMGGGYGTGVVGPYYYGMDHSYNVPVGPIPGTLRNPLYRPVVAENRATAESPKMAPAHLVLELPADAKLYVDDQLVTGEGSTRKFHTPDLAPAKSFFYDLRAEIRIGNEVVVESTRVIVRAGQEVKESFPKLIAAAKANSKDAVAAK